MTESGLECIKHRHGDDFAARGVETDQIGKTVMWATTSGRESGLVVGHGRPVTLLDRKGTTVPLAMSKAASGYLISAHPEPLARVEGTAWPPPVSSLVGVRLAAEWGAGPLWLRFETPNGTEIANYLPEEVRDVLDLPAELLLRIGRWDHDYQRILDHEYPPNSEFPDEEAALAFRRTGYALARELRAAVADRLAVEYVENFGDRVITLEPPRIGVTVYEVDPAAPPVPEASAVAIHVDLPHSQRQQWHRRLGPAGVREVDVRAVASAAALANAVDPGAATVVQALTQVRAHALVFTKVEQLGVKNRPVLTELLHALPSALARRRAANQPLGVGLVDLSADKADTILAELHDAPADDIDAPIPVLDYPTMA